MGLYKSKGITQANQTLNKWFSIYIRLRDSDENGIAECITCDYKAQWNDGFDTGHFADGDRLATRWNEWNAHAQCKSCNLTANGEQWRHGEAIKLLHGKEIPDELIAESKETVAITKKKRMEMAREYKQMAEELAEQKGVEI